jgi:hypothetical protein
MSKVLTGLLASLFSLAMLESGALAEEPSDSDIEAWIRESTVEKSFLVVGTYRTYLAARRASERLGARAGVEHRPQTVVLEDGQPTYTREECEENGWGYPCYVARGRYDDGVYFSVEPSDAYDGMKKGYFVVIAASGSDDEVRSAARELRKRRIASTVRTSHVWMGCMH